MTEISTYKEYRLLQLLKHEKGFENWKPHLTRKTWHSPCTQNKRDKDPCVSGYSVSHIRNIYRLIKNLSPKYFKIVTFSDYKSCALTSC